MPILLTPEQLEFLRSVDTPTLSNAIEWFQVRDRTEGFVGSDVRCLFPRLGTMVGYALTATGDSTTPGQPRSREGWYRLMEALEAAPKPAVLVIKNVGPDRGRSCHFGEVMANTSRRMGAIGLVTDGGVRDLAEVEALGFHYFAAGAVASHGNFGIVDVGVPVELSGCHIQTGDIVHGDLNGLIVVPGEVVARLPEAVERVRASERRTLEFVNGPDFSLRGLRDLFTH